MQLAATPRPHPPPVPPRPSRQVVAEALKRSPRPPCPTRQAPPPPDTKPWRAQDQENLPRGTPGRTVIYDSGDKPTNDFDGTETVESMENQSIVEEKNTESVRREEQPPPTHPNQKSNKPQQQREFQQQLTAAPRMPSERSERKTTSTNSSSILNPCSNASPQRILQPVPPGLRPTPAERLHQQISHSNLRVHQLRLTNSPTEPLSLSSPQSLLESKLSETPSSPSPQKLINQRNIQVVNGAVVFEAQNPLVKSPAASLRPVENGTTENNGNSVGESSSSNNSNKDSSSLPSSPPSISSPISSKNPDAKSEVLTESEEDRTKSSPLNKTISNDDCATVVQVVLDEPERRVAFDESVNIQHEDWLEAGVRYSSTKITLSGDEIPEETSDPTEDQVNGFHSAHEEELISTFDFASIKEKIAMSSLQGLPPLPRSLSGFNLSVSTREGNEPPPPPARSSSRPQRGTRPTQPTGRPPPPPQGRQLTTLDTQLAKLRREMFGLRQLDLSLLSQLWSLNESIQEFRQLLQEQDDRAPSPSPSSEEGDDTSYGSHPPPHPRRPPPVSHHHRTPRPPQRNDSPSSEEYGAV